MPAGLKNLDILPHFCRYYVSFKKGVFSMTIKDKNIAGLLALFLGPLGAHRFYLDQVGLGIFYLLFFWFPITWFIAFVDAIIFFTMSPEKFDAKYNHGKRTRQTDKRADRPWPSEPPATAPRRKSEPEKRQHTPGLIAQELKNAGIKKFKEFDYDGAIADFEKALQIDAKDIALHFNLACAYSLNENPPKSFFHLDKAVSLGFKDFQRIKQHDALAYLRIQPDFEAFEQNNFRLINENTLVTEPAETMEQLSGNLLEQLSRLGELRDKGLLSEEEFVAQKKKILRN